MEKINVFDWNDPEKGFGKIMNPSQSPLDKGGSKGGFDCVIGNPPYGAWFTDTEDAYFSKKFAVFLGVKDIYALFIEHGFYLLKRHGLISFIVPSAWTGGPSYFTLRQMILGHRIDKILMLPFDIFESAYIDTLVFVASKNPPEKAHLVKTFTYPKKERLIAVKLDQSDYLKVNQKSWVDSGDKKLVLNPYALRLIEKIQKTTTLRFTDKIRIVRGVLFDKKLLTSKKITERHFKYFEGDVYRYVTNEILDNWVEFGHELKERPKEFEWFEGKRILLRRLVNRQQRLMASLAEDAYITNKNLYVIKTLQKELSHEVILGVLNSKLISYLYLHQISQATKDDFPQVTIRDITNLPFPNMKSHSKALHLSVDRMLGLNKKLMKVKTPHEKELLERQIKITDNQIDKLVYELYGLTEEEIRVVEGE